MALLSVHMVLAVALLVVGVAHLATCEFAGRATDTVSLRRRLRPTGPLAIASPVVAALTVVSGLLLTLTHGSRFDRAWIIATLVLVAALVVNAPVVQGPHLRRLEHALAAAPAGPLSRQLRLLLASVPLRTGQRMTLCLQLGIVYLMVEQPGTTGSLVTCLVLALSAMVLVATQRRGLAAVPPAQPVAEPIAS
ncbi:MAG TPA: hypothetical protein VF892_05030 [Pseudonocardiaceae bacterium]